MLWKYNSSLEDHINMSRCIVDLSNGNYRTELDLYSHFLKRVERTKNSSTNKHKYNTDFLHELFKKKSNLVCVSKRRKMKSRTMQRQRLLKIVLCSFLLFHRCQNHKGFPYMARENIDLILKAFYSFTSKFLVK